MPNAFGSPEHWRHRAAVARTLADQMIDPQAKTAMRQIANSYDLVAEVAEEWVAKKPENLN